jgi:anti-sigma regulatory factor (Ser/Thr protein kinase)
MKRTRSFDHTPESVPLARRFAADTLRGAPEDAVDAVAMMVSELASNCIRHTESGFKLEISLTAHEIRVEATDRGSDQPRMRTAEPTDPDGRGLQIIDMLAETWGTEPQPGQGKTVWFTVAIAARAAATSTVA